MQDADLLKMSIYHMSKYSCNTHKYTNFSFLSGTDILQGNSQQEPNQQRSKIHMVLVELFRALHAAWNLRINRVPSSGHVISQSIWTTPAI